MNFDVAKYLDVCPRLSGLSDYVRRVEGDLEDAEVNHVPDYLQCA